MDRNSEQKAIGDSLISLIEDLYPLNRSLTGDGVRATLQRLTDIIPLSIHEVPSGTEVLDWTVPSEWNISDAYIKNSSGDKVVDFRECNLHVMGYSIPFNGKLSRSDLLPHLHSDPDRPDSIPYRTSYYSEDWGFCLSDKQLQSLPEDTYEVLIDSTLTAGSMSYGELVIPGETDSECLIYTHTCHPSLCNDNLSGIAVCTYLAKWLGQRRNRLTYRLVLAPGTIGSITWLARNQDILPRINSGLVIALVGDSGPLHYKRTRTGNRDIDRIVEGYLQNEAPGSRITDFTPWGYDERQFGSPGFKLPVGRLTRSAEEEYPEYHSSADNLGIIDQAALTGSLLACRGIIEILDANARYRNLAPYGEPQLGKRGIYRKTGGGASPELQRALLWILSLSDGENDLADIYIKSKLPFQTILEATRILLSADLLEEMS
jgi:aminopeptidase-like protein